jgi:hypothetical protein
MQAWPLGDAESPYYPTISIARKTTPVMAVWMDGFISHFVS